MVQISISTIILAVLACVGPTLAAPIRRDFNGLETPETRPLSDPCRHFHSLKRTVAGTETADPLKRELGYHGIEDCSDIYITRDVDDFVFEREIGDHGDNGGPRHERRFFDLEDETRDAKRKAHEQLHLPETRPVTDPCPHFPGHSLKRAVAGTEPADPRKRELGYNGLKDCSDIFITRDVDDFVFKREIGDRGDNGRPRHERLLPRADFRGEAQDAKRKAHERPHPPGGALSNDAKGLGGKREKALNHRRDLDDEILQMFARDFDEGRYRP